MAGCDELPLITFFSQQNRQCSLCSVYFTVKLAPLTIQYIVDVPSTPVHWELTCQIPLPYLRVERKYNVCVSHICHNVSVRLFSLQCVLSEKLCTLCSKTMDQQFPMINFPSNDYISWPSVLYPNRHTESVSDIGHWQGKIWRWRRILIFI